MICKKYQKIDNARKRSSGFIPIKEIVVDVMIDIVSKRRSNVLQRSENTPKDKNI